MMMTMMMMTMMMMIDDDVLKHVHLSHTPTRFFLKLIQLSKMRQGVISKLYNAPIIKHTSLKKEMLRYTMYPIQLKECVGNFQRFQQLRSFASSQLHCQNLCIGFLFLWSRPNYSVSFGLFISYFQMR